MLAKPGWTPVLMNPRVDTRGKTSTMVEAARKLGATLVCMNAQEAHRVQQEYGIETVSVHINPDVLRGTDTLYVFDPDAVAALTNSYDEEIANLESKLRDAKRRLIQIEILLKEDPKED